jgi:hypothetical protein
MLLVVTALKLITETALMVLLGQWLLGALAGARRDDNLAYQLLQMAGRPFVALARWLSPRWVVDRHLPLVAALMLVFSWLALTFVKIRICLQIGAVSCQ